MIETGLYIIKDQFFSDMADPYLKYNKGESRPHYYCFKDTEDHIFWMIPLSSRVEKYQRIIARRKAAKKPCDILHIVKLPNDKESAFLIQDMFPVTESYIEREYKIAGNHLMLTSDKDIRIINHKARKVLGMLKRGVRFTPTQPDSMAILAKLKSTL